MRKFKDIANGSTFQRPDDRTVFSKIDQASYRKSGKEGKFYIGGYNMEVIPVLQHRTMTVSSVKGIMKIGDNTVFVPQNVHGKLKTIRGNMLTVVFDHAFKVDQDGQPGTVIQNCEVENVDLNDIFFNDIETRIEIIKD